MTVLNWGPNSSRTPSNGPISDSFLSARGKKPERFFRSSVALATVWWGAIISTKGTPLVTTEAILFALAVTIGVAALYYKRSFGLTVIALATFSVATYLLTQVSMETIIYYLS
jgi:hypothetical protein